MNIAIFSGSDIFDFNERVEYIRESFQQAIRLGAKYILLIGGKIRGYMTLTQAELNKKIMDDHLSLDGLWPEVVVLSAGLAAAKKWIGEQSIDMLLLCEERSRIVDFLVDASTAGLLDLNSGVMIYGHSLPGLKGLGKIKKRSWIAKLFSSRERQWRKEIEKAIGQKRGNI